MLRRNNRTPGPIIQTAVVVAGFALAWATRQAVWQSAHLDLPLFSMFPAVTALAIALGPVAGIIAMLTAVAYVLLGPAAPAFARWSAETQAVLILGFCSLSVLICAMVAMLDRRVSVDLSALLADLGKAEERLKAVMSSIDGHGIFLLDREGRIAGCATRTCPVTAWTEREMLGMDLSAFYPEGQAGEDMARWDLVTARDRGRVRTTGQFRDRKGEMIPAEATLTSLTRGQGFCVVIRDLRHVAAARSTAAA